MKVRFNKAKLFKQIIEAGFTPLEDTYETSRESWGGFHAGYAIHYSVSLAEGAYIAAARENDSECVDFDIYVQKRSQLANAEKLAKLIIASGHTADVRMATSSRRLQLKGDVARKLSQLYEDELEELLKIIETMEAKI